MTIQEPMTLLTDYLLAGWVIWLGWRLWGGGLPARLWAGAFWAIALAAVAGGTVHGFQAALGESASLALWRITVYAVGLGGFLLVAGALRGILPGGIGRWLLGLAGVKLALYLAWMSFHEDFLFVILNYAPDLLAVLGLALWAWWRRREPGALPVIGGILVSMAASAIQALGLAPHPHFNHNDLYHVVQMGAFYLLYLGGGRLGEGDSP